MNKALENSLSAYKFGAEWLDGTIWEEDLKMFFVSHFYKRNSSTCINIYKLSKNFINLKKKYNWGTNKYYYLSGLYKIHPT